MVSVVVGLLRASAFPHQSTNQTNQPAPPPPPPSPRGSFGKSSNCDGDDDRPDRTKLYYQDTLKSKEVGAKEKTFIER